MFSTMVALPGSKFHSELFIRIIRTYTTHAKEVIHAARNQPNAGFSNMMTAGMSVTEGFRSPVAYIHRTVSTAQ